MTASPLEDMDRSDPPAGLTAPLQALWWIKKGNFQVGEEWHKAHEICQNAEGTRSHDLIHALLHLIEGDHANSAYWYRRAGEDRKSDDPQVEWGVIAGILGTD